MTIDLTDLTEIFAAIRELEEDINDLLSKRSLKKEPHFNARGVEFYTRLQRIVNALQQLSPDPQVIEAKDSAIALTNKVLEQVFQIKPTNEQPVNCDYSHYSDDGYEITKPAHLWLQDDNGAWTPLCGPCLPEFWYGDDARQGGPWVVYPITVTPPGKKRIRRNDI